MFYIIVPFYAIEVKHESMIAKLKNIFLPKVTKKEKTETFLQQKDQLWQRASHVQQTLSGTGIRLVPLKTQELIELYYSLYNPGLAEKEELGAIGDLDIQ